MKCKDCIHHNVCIWENELEEESNKHCSDFKNKADFVEVVRCSQCKYKDDCAGRMVHTTRDYVLEQNISTYNKVDFCSYGERKDGKDINAPTK